VTPIHPLLEAVRALGDTTVADERIDVTLPHRPPLASPERVTPRLVVTAGLYDLLAETSLAGMPDDGAREAILREALTDISSIEPPLRFAVYERSRKAEQLERAARMRGLQNVATDRWLVPRLEAEIETYEARVLALQRALEERPR
jgi:hypothetical protein